MTAPTVRISFDRTVFDLDTIKRAAYRFSGRASFDFLPTDSEITCVITPAVASPPESLIADFKAEVLDQDLRAKIRAETAPIRNAILALAFAPIRRE